MTEFHLNGESRTCSVLWNVAGAFVNPNGIRVYWKVFQCDVNVLFTLSAFSTGTGQFPELQSRVEKNLGTSELVDTLVHPRMRVGVRDGTGVEPSVVDAEAESAALFKRKYDGRSPGAGGGLDDPDGKWAPYFHLLELALLGTAR